MDKTVDIEKLKRLANKTKSWSKSDKQWLLPVLEQLSIDAPTKNNCPSCWRDAAIMALVKIKAADAKPVNGFRLKGTAATNGVVWMGRLVAPGTLDAAMVEWLKQTNFPRHLYEQTDEQQ